MILLPTKAFTHTATAEREQSQRDAPAGGLP